MENEVSKNSIVGWWKHVVQNNYSNFNGRARRAEYWNFALANFLLYISLVVVGFIGASLGLNFIGYICMIGYVILALGLLIPSIAVLVRRLHDINKSGWYYFIALIPLAGPIILLVWLFKEGDKGPNQYGEDPKKSMPDFDFENKA
jgi:uncharacterized membrane protein YhaH (DUF805 family)